MSDWQFVDGGVNWVLVVDLDLFREKKMDKEFLKKLINLANKNPNENEANSSARLVCKLLNSYSFPDEPSDMLDYNKWCLRHHCPKAHCKCG